MRALRLGVRHRLRLSTFVMVSIVICIPPFETRVLATPVNARTLTVEDAVSIARDYSFALRRDGLDAANLGHSYRETKANALPQVGLTSEIKSNLHSPTFMGTAMNRRYESGVGVTMTQAIYSFGVVTNALKAADAAIRMQQFSRKSILREIEFTTRLAYINALIAKQQIDIANQSLENAKANLEVLNQQFSTGRPPQADLIRLNADIAARRTQLIAAKSQRRLAEIQLKSLLGFSLADDIVLASELLQPTSMEWTELSSEDFIQLPQAMATVEDINLKQSLVDLQRARGMPSVGAFASLNKSMQSDANPFQEERRMDSVIVGVQLSWTLWDSGQNRARIAQASGERAKAEISLQELRRNFEGEYVSLKEAYHSAQEAIVATKDAIKLAQQSFELSQRRFQAGRTSVAELNDVDTMLTQLRTNELQNIFRLHEAYLGLQKLVPLSSTLKEMN